jgi:hypothetical protein
LDFLIKSVLQGLPSLEERFNEISKINLHALLRSKKVDDDEGGWSKRQSIKQRRISSWSFNEVGFELDPVYPTLPTNDFVVKKVRFGGESLVIETSELIPSSSRQVLEKATQVDYYSEGDGVLRQRFVGNSIHGLKNAYKLWDEVGCRLAVRNKNTGEGKKGFC